MPPEAITAIIASVVSFISTIITLFIATFLERKRKSAEEHREFLSSQLSEFYDPIFALLSVNKNVFDRIGPNSLLTNESQYIIKERKHVWETLVIDVILPNNQKICDIINMKSYLMHQKDNINLYLEFITHASAYKVFREKRYERYENFTFPQGFLENVTGYRQELYSKLHSLD